jgi:hypothetical protein
MEYVLVLALWIICFAVMWGRYKKWKCIEARIDSLNREMDEIIKSKF